MPLTGGYTYNLLFRAIFESDGLLWVVGGHCEHAMHVLEAVSNITNGVAGTALEVGRLGRAGESHEYTWG